MTLLLLHLVRIGLVCLLNDPIFWRVHILPDRPLLLTWSRHIPVTSDRECPPPPGTLVRQIKLRIQALINILIFTELHSKFDSILHSNVRGKYMF